MKFNLMILFITLCHIAIADTVLWQQDFEEQVPGEHPKGWGEKKQPADALAVITNTAEELGQKQLVLDMASGQDTSKARPLLKRLNITPSKDANWLSCSFVVCLKGRGAKCGFEIRDKSLKKRLACISFGNKFGPNITVYSGRWKHSAPAGRYKLNTWYRITCQLPLNNKSDQLQCSIDYLDKDKWQTQKTSTLPFDIKTYTPLGFYVGMPRKDSKFYIDSITVKEVKIINHKSNN